MPQQRGPRTRTVGVQRESSLVAEPGVSTDTCAFSACPLQDYLQINTHAAPAPSSWNNHVSRKIPKKNSSRYDLNPEADHSTLAEMKVPAEGRLSKAGVLPSAGGLEGAGGSGPQTPSSAPHLPHTLPGTSRWEPVYSASEPGSKL